jgi:acyl transferase domain-containing protein
MIRMIVNKSSRSDVFIPMDLGNVDAISNVSHAVCSLWQAGSATQFWLLHAISNAGHRYQAVNVPPYQFGKTSHWIQLKKGSAHSENSSQQQSLVSLVSKTSSGESLFSVNTTHFVFVTAARDHAVTRQSLCPASMYIELATLASRPVTQTRAKNQMSEFLPHVEGLTMSAPLGLGSDNSLFLRLNQIAPGSCKFHIQPPAVDYFTRDSRTRGYRTC